MKLIEQDSISLIDFYRENGLEFDENKGYFGSNVKSFALLEAEKLIGEITISNYQDKSFLEALAVDTQYRKKGYGSILLDKAIKELKKPIYTISKTDDFYLKNGFVYDNADLIGEECKTCNEYQVTCFPKVMVYQG